ncbi:MAG: class IV adenylate cyclase [Gemmatimonadetes bacterium]|nr:class IV adenylate cyclase [Gemmatimonadota bacterium]MBI3567735.1 class IV adenylate cyclase [Gemmatimonadota bacterium]
MREVELKALVPDAAALQAALHRAGAERSFAGHLTDRRYDTPGNDLIAKDVVLRLRSYSDATGTRAALDWKGPTGYDAGYKVREERSTDVDDGETLATILDGLGYVVVREIDRDIAQYRLHGATVRIEWYPRMDVLVEVEGEPAAIEAAIAATGLPRESFTAERLPDFVARYEARTGQRAAICRSELDGDYRYSATNA